MRDDVKREFVDALLSGDYEQVMGILATGNNGRCATGVLCEVAARHGVTSVTEWGFVGQDGISINSGPPLCVYEWSGVDVLDMEEIMVLNDHGYTFEQIADLVKNDQVGSEFAKQFSHGA